MRKKIGLTHQDGKSYHIGPSRLLRVLSNMQRDEAIRTLQMMWPDMPWDIANLILRYPEEVRVSGANLIIPRSWELKDETK